MSKTETVQRVYNEKGELISEVTTTYVVTSPVVEDATLKIGMYL
jgi:hypothetical protein